MRFVPLGALLACVLASPALAQGQGHAYGHKAVGGFIADSVAPAPTVVTAPLTGTTTVTTAAATTAGGVPVGLSGLPTSAWCAGPLKSSVTTVSPTGLRAHLRAAKACGMHVWVTFPRTYERTTWGASSGRFSPSNSKRLVDWYLQQVPASEMQGYVADGTFLGFVVMDDMRCTACWGGHLVLQSEIIQLTTYARSRLPVPVTLRITPDWIAYYRGLNLTVDAAWAQYTKNKGSPTTWFASQMTQAKNLGINLVAAVSVYSCQTVATMDPCTATEVKTFFKAGLDQSVCAANGWRYDSQVNGHADVKAAYQWVADYAKTKAARSCKRAA